MIVLKSNSGQGFLSDYQVDSRQGVVEPKFSDDSTASLYFHSREEAVDFIIKNNWKLEQFQVAPADFSAALAVFVRQVQMLVSENDRRFDKIQFNTTLTTEFGRRYVRVVKSDGTGSRSVYCFVDQNTGNVLKADGWKRPAKHARGNIYAEDGGLGGATAYGAAYIRY